MAGSSPSSEQQRANASGSENMGLTTGVNSLLPLSSRSDHSLPTVYFGPTSSITVIEDGNELNTLEQGSAEGLTVHLTTSASWSTQGATEVVECLRDFPIIKTLIHDYYNVSQSAVIASPLILQALAQIEVTYQDNLLGNPEQISELTAFILTNTERPFDVPLTTDGTNVHELYTGPSLRLEIFGIIYALAGRASSFGLSYSKHYDYAGSVTPAQFSRKMLAASDIAIHSASSSRP